MQRKTVKIKIADSQQLIRYTVPVSTNLVLLKDTEMAQAGQDFSLSPAYKMSQAGKVPRTYLVVFRLRFALSLSLSLCRSVALGRH